MQHVVVFITAPSKKEAGNISKILLDARLAACTNIIGGVDSHFWWKAKKEGAKEWLLVAKTRKMLVQKLIDKVKAAHPYEVPEVIAIPIIAGYQPYLDWIQKETER